MSMPWCFLVNRRINLFLKDSCLTAQISRRNRLKELSKDPNIQLVFYESCHRILATLEDIQSVFGDKDIVVARELTKKFEEVKRGKPADLIAHFKKTKPRGEFVVVI